MKITHFKFIVLPILSLCLFVSTSLAAHAQEANEVSFVRGAKVWADNCMRCHSARDPQDFSVDQWKVIMSHMRIQAGLSGSEARDTLKFLIGSNTKKQQSIESDKDVNTSKQVLNTASGKQIYLRTCIACHGADGKGTIAGVPDFTDKDGPLTKSDTVLKKHIAEGFQSPGSSMAMPAKGGNPNLSEADIVSLLKYMRDYFSK